MPEPVSSPGRRTTPKGDRPLVLNGRRRVGAAITAALLAVAIGSVPSSPAQAEPTIDEVQTRVDRLYHEAEQASERYNAAKVELDELRKDLDSLRADEDRQDDRLTSVREQVQDSIVSQYQGTTLSAVGQAVVSDDPARFLVPADDDRGLQRHPVPALRRLHHRAQGPRHPSCRHRGPSRRDGHARAAAGQGEGDDRREARRRQGAARRAQGRGARGAPRLPQRRRPAAPRRPGLRARGGRRRSTPWPRWATPTSTARPARAPSTAPG